MKRRTFLSTAAMLGMTPVSGIPQFENSKQSKGEQYFEWIRYHLPVGSRQGLTARYYRDVAIPALNKAGIDNVGVFNVKHGDNQPTLHVIIPHPSLESVITLNDRLLNDEKFVQAGEHFLNAPTSEKAFLSMEKTLLKAFSKFPQIQVPKQKKANSPRIFQARTYESPNLIAAKKKLHQFNEGGEVDIFIRTGLQPVLFGEIIAGDRMPGLVYLLAFDNMADLAKSWATFDADPTWLELFNDPYYGKNIVSCINDWIWTPTAFSQI